jgi:hypothetical protein
MKLSWQGFKKAWLYQLVLLFAFFCVWFYLRTAAYLAGPADGDLYAQTWSFQFMVGGLYLVGAIPLLALLFLLEAGLFRIAHRLAQSQPGAQADGPASGGPAA